MRLNDVFRGIPSSISASTKNADELRAFWSRNYATLLRIEEAEAALQERLIIDRSSGLTGYSETAGEEVLFSICAPHRINWREDVVCPKTRLNNRSRASISILQRLCGMAPKSDIYLTEQTTPLWAFLYAAYPGIVGSEYLGDQFDRGAETNGIRHEDMTRLSFASDSFDVVASFDCLEHIPGYTAAIGELYRVLRPGGTALLTFPFNGKDQTLVRAELGADGSIVHHVEPEYHGDPVNASGGILCYYHFGYDVLETLNAAGFVETSVYWFWSAAMGNLGGLQAYVIARKARCDARTGAVGAD